MPNISFGKWDEHIHQLPEQQDRIIRARSATTTPDSVDKESKTAVFKAGKYQVTLDSCTCVDFSRTRRPCKHIYRLAMELGLLEDNTCQTGEKYDDKSDLLQSYEGLDLETKKLLKPIFYQLLYSRSVVFLERGSLSDLLVHTGLFIETDSLSAVSQLPAIELKVLFEKMKFNNAPKLTSQAKTFIKWAENNQDEFSKANDVFSMLELNPRADSLKNTIYRRLCKLFPDTF